MKQYNGIAFFDLDETITSKDTYLEFIKFAVGKRNFYFGLLFHFAFIIPFLLNLYHGDKLKLRFFNFYLKRFTEKELLQLGAKFSREVLPKICYPKALEKLAWHKAQNHRIIILTASSPIWLDEWCKANGLEIIGTNYEVINGCYTGKFEGKNNYGIQKKYNIQPILAETKYEVSYGYGDSKSDLYFMELTDNSVFGTFA